MEGIIKNDYKMLQILKRMSPSSDSTKALEQCMFQKHALMSRSDINPLDFKMQFEMLNTRQSKLINEIITHAPRNAETQRLELELHAVINNAHAEYDSGIKSACAEDQERIAGVKALVTRCVQLGMTEFKNVLPLVKELEIAYGVRDAYAMNGKEPMKLLELETRCDEINERLLGMLSVL